jgi:hypothetical protein
MQSKTSLTPLNDEELIQLLLDEAQAEVTSQYEYEASRVIPVYE